MKYFIMHRKGWMTIRKGFQRGRIGNTNTPVYCDVLAEVK